MWSRMVHLKFNALTILLLAAFMLRALIPSGWMPQASNGDGVTLVICTAAGMKQIVLGPDGEPVDDAPNATHEPCPFAAWAKFPPPLLAVSLAPHLSLGSSEPIADTPIPPQATHLRLAAPRAPPVRA
jgi:hypothetical protein